MSRFLTSLLLIVSCAVLAVSAVSATESAQPVVFGTKKYIELVPGSLPLVISAPHGGTLKPADMKDRTFGRVLSDGNTEELARAICDELAARCGGRPHLIVCHLHRVKVDCNRELQEAAQGDAQATTAWKEYHDFISRSCKAVTEQFGAGLYLDIHGQRHLRGWVELGYALPATTLDLADEKLDADPAIAARSSVADADRRSPESFAVLLRGASSLGTLIAGAGFPSVPSTAIPTPGRDDYFSGGYDIQAHGSAKGGSISAIQIECPWGVREIPAARKKFASALVQSLEPWFKTHLGMELRAK